MWTYVSCMSVFFLFQNNPEKALEDCNESLNLNPRYRKALLRRAKAAERLNNLDLSLEDLAAACLLDNFIASDSLAELDRIAKATGKLLLPHSLICPTFGVFFFLDSTLGVCVIYS